MATCKEKHHLKYRDKISWVVKRITYYQGLRNEYTDFSRFLVVFPRFADEGLWPHVPRY